MTTERPTRQHETTIELPASVEEAWRAITDDSEVQKWYAPQARVEAKVGGDYFVSWGAGLDGPGIIEVFEPPRHLRVVSERKSAGECEGTAKEIEPARVAIDYYLEGRKGKTTLRLVHSGFLTSSDWDNEYEGTRQGWPIMLAILRYSFQHYPGVRGQQEWLYRTAAMPVAEVWTRFTEGVRVGAVEVSKPPQLFSAGWEAMGSGLISAAFAQRGDMTGVSLHVVMYGEASDRIGEVAKFWRNKLSEMFPAPAGIKSKAADDVSCGADALAS